MRDRLHGRSGPSLKVTVPTRHHRLSVGRGIFLGASLFPFDMSTREASHTSHRLRPTYLPQGAGKTMPSMIPRILREDSVLPTQRDHQRHVVLSHRPAVLPTQRVSTLSWTDKSLLAEGDREIHERIRKHPRITQTRTRGRELLSSHSVGSGVRYVRRRLASAPGSDDLAFGSRAAADAIRFAHLVSRSLPT